MRNRLQRISKFYSNIIMKNIGIFMFVGLLEVFFGPNGWLEHEDIYAISQLITGTVLPLFLAYSVAEAISGYAGGIVAVLATTGMVIAERNAGIMVAMVLGGISGVLWKRYYGWLEQKIGAGFEMLSKNLSIAFVGIVLAQATYYVVTPLFGVFLQLLAKCMDFLVRYQLLFLMNLLIEPGKILFLNNSINYGILIPLGMQQLEMQAKSIMFLLETNPGPGFGILMAMYLWKRERRREYGVSAAIQLIGGIHEIYFPVVLDNPWLLVALLAGGTAGTLVFQQMQVGLSAPAAPGSLVVILLMAGKEQLLKVLLGIAVSAGVSLLTGLAVLFLGKGKGKTRESEKGAKVEKDEDREQKMNQIKKIGFVCDGGMGSSVMGASILRKKLREKGVLDITVTAHPVDLVPEDLDLLVCQISYLPILRQEVSEDRAVYTVETLVSSQSYDALVDEMAQMRGDR